MGQRLDKVLCELVPEFSRSYLQQLLAAGAVSLNGQVQTKAAHRVKVADAGQITLRPTAQSQAFKAEVMGLDVVFEDAHLCVINKPAGLVVHPAPGHWQGTLMNALLGRYADAVDLPRAGIVHRLDKDTSGLMVVARSRASMDALVKAIAARTVKRQYLALAYGRWLGQALRVHQGAIGRDPRNRLRMAVVDLTRHSGKPARTDFELLANADAACAVHGYLHSGRTHQIRVHLADWGHPLLGDALYGGRSCAGLTRQALHAVKLGLFHPATGVQMQWQAPPPADLQAAMAQLGIRYNPG
jgi:23S rRNA pseudouridine1911/1915/1917 synthase